MLKIAKNRNQMAANQAKALPHFGGGGGSIHSGMPSVRQGLSSFSFEDPCSPCLFDCPFCLSLFAPS